MGTTTDPLQVESPSSVDKAASWAILPVEIRHRILNFVGLPISQSQNNGLVSQKLAPFATVCREWQVFFETRIFRRLVLDVNSLADFDAIIRRSDIRLGYIRKLWLRIKLTKYDCPDCDYEEDARTRHLNNILFTVCLQSLLATLKLWDPTRHGEQGLALMLSVSSSSDTEHRFSRCEMNDDYPFHYAEDLALAPSMVEFHQKAKAASLNHLIHRGREWPWHNGHIRRLHGTPLRLVSRNERGRFINPHKVLPAVPVVKGLVMRRQFRREIHIGTLSCLCARSFVALEWFRFERTLSVKPQHQLAFDKGFQSCLLPSLPKTLRQFSFTQWDIPAKERGFTLGSEAPGMSLHIQDRLPRLMAKLSQRLEQFCPPWQMDTAAFLQSIIENGESPKTPQSSLKRLILRCALSSPEKSRLQFESLVLSAAEAALSLPQLEVIELWGTCLDEQNSCAYIFRYSYEDRRANIVWRSFDKTMVCQARTIAMWSEVAKAHSHSTLTCDVVPFAETKEDIYRSDGTCIYRHLLLKDLAFDPITRILLENESYI
ncbi:hypothetical protein V8C44DRAFT_187120 [Trichoderma aethiopicum]